MERAQDLLRAALGALLIVLAALGAFGNVASASAASTPGVVSGWGDNESDQLGVDASTGPQHCAFNTPCSTTPIAVAGLSGVTAVAPGSYHSLALLSNGTVLGWGDNSSGELGDGTTTSRPQPEPVSGLSGVVAIAAGHYWSAAVLSNGTVMTWGANESGELGDGTHTGPQTCGGPSDPCSTVPVAVGGLTGVTAIGGGYRNLVALRSDGTVVTWGDNTSGELGIGTSTGPDTCNPGACSTTPVAVSGLNGVTAIAGGDSHNLALLENGTVLAWGLNSSGQLGDGTNTERHSPVPVSNLSGVAALAAGDRHSLALLADGTARAWGDNASGELGNPAAGGSSSTPVVVSGLNGVLALSAGLDFSLALLSDHSVMSWGGNAIGSLGNGGTTNTSTPAPVSGVGGAIALGPETETDTSLVVQGAFASVSPGSVAFGEQPLRTVSTPRTVTVTNSGPAPLPVSGESLTGAAAAAFEKASDTCAGTTLAPGASCQIGLRFVPRTAGTASAALTVQSLAANTLAPLSVSGVGLGHPIISRARETHKRWRRGAKPARIARKHRAPIGTTFSFKLDHAARVRLAFTRRVRGRRVGKHCVAPNGRNRRARGCTRTVTFGTLGFGAVAGRHRVSFQGRVSRTRKLRPGRYTLVITATDAAGRSKPVKLRFTIV